MNDPDFIRLVEQAAGVLAREPLRLHVLPEGCPVVYIGDTHGDSDATRRVFARFPPDRFLLVFLGDYVDRGPDSLGNVRLLLAEKLAHPDRVVLLMGNHEGWKVAPFQPADFWHGLPTEAAELLGRTFLQLPLAAWHPLGVLAVHGGLPEVGSLEAFDDIENGDANWRNVTWGDWQEDGTPESPWDCRPSLDHKMFERISARLGVKVLVRSHQPFAPTYLYEDRCLTVFTSCAYGDGHRQVAILRPDQCIRSAKDLDVIDV